MSDPAEPVPYRSVTDPDAPGDPEAPGAPAPPEGEGELSAAEPARARAAEPEAGVPAALAWPPPGVATPEPADTRSYSARYRDTAWGDPGSTPASSPIAAERRRGSRILLAAGVLLLAASVVAGVALAATGQLHGILGIGPAPTDTLPGAPAGTTDPVAAAAAIDAFVGVATDPKLSYEIRMKGTLESGDATGTTALTGKVAGKDVDARFSVTLSTGTSMGARMIVKGKTVWILLDGEKTWRKTKPSPGQLPDVNAFAGIEAADQLAHVGREMRRGSLTHHLVTTEAWTPPNAAATLAAYPGMRIDQAKLDIWARPDGRPVEARFSLLASAGGPFGTTSLTSSVTYVFSNVGGRLTIKAPK